MPVADLSVLLAGLNPTNAQVASLFTLLKRIPKPILDTMFQSMDEQMLQKMAMWAQTFFSDVNALPAVTPAALVRLVNPDLTDDFIQAAQNATLNVPLLDQNDLDEMNNNMTKAIKAQNWLEALQAGVALAGAVPVA